MLSDKTERKGKAWMCVLSLFYYQKTSIYIMAAIEIPALTEINDNRKRNLESGKGGNHADQ